MLKIKKEITLKYLEKMIYLHTHDLDGNPDTNDALEQEYITKELIKLRDLITAIWPEKPTKKIKVKRGTAQNILDGLGITDKEFNEAKKRL